MVVSANHKVIGLVICVVHASSLSGNPAQIYIESKGKQAKIRIEGAC